MQDTRWGRWLIRLTGETSERAIAKRVGVSHTTIQRWVRSGVPPGRAWGLVVRFKGDPIEVIVLLGKIQPSDVQRLNWDAVVKYAPARALTEELHDRTVKATTEVPSVDPRKMTVAV